MYIDNLYYKNVGPISNLDIKRKLQVQVGHPHGKN